MVTVDLIILFSFIKRLTKPFTEWKAFKLGIIDENGEFVKSRKDFTSEESSACTYFDVLILNLKKLLMKLPGGATRIATFAAALFLLKEEHDFNEERLHTLLETLEPTYWSIVGAMRGGLISLNEDEGGSPAGGAPSTNSTNIAGKDMPLGGKSFKMFKRKNEKEAEVDDKVKKLAEELNILLESEARVNFLKNKYMKQMEARWDHDDIEVLWQEIVNGDPTRDKIYLDWLIRMMLAKNSNIYFRDLPSVRQELDWFDKGKQYLDKEYRDINHWNIYLAFVEIAYKAEKLWKKAQTAKQLETETKKQVKTIYRGPLGIIQIPETPAAAQFLGLNTKWCTASTDRPEWATENFRNYTFGEHNLYVLILPNHKKYQWSFVDNQFTNEENKFAYMDDSEIYHIMIRYAIKHEGWSRSDITSLLKTHRKLSMDTFADVIAERLGTSNGLMTMMFKEMNAFRDLERWPNFEPYLLKEGRLGFLVNIYYREKFSTDKKLKDRWPELEKLIIQEDDIVHALDYVNLHHGPIVEFEPMFLKSPSLAFEYARAVFYPRINEKLKSWPAGEKVLARSAAIAYKYVSEITWKRFPLAEPELAKDPHLAMLYAIAMDERFPAGEEAIKSSPNDYREYLDFLKNRIPKPGEK